VFGFDPPGAETDLKPPSGDDVEGGGHVGQDRRMPIGIAGHKYTKADPRHDAAECSQHRPPLEHRSGSITEYGVEVIERPAGVVQLDPVPFLPEVHDGLPFAVLGAGLEGEAHGVPISR
jgi:hypothetical protein